MKKSALFLFLLLSSFNFANADYLMPSLGKCVSDYYINQTDGTLKYIYSGTTTVISSTTKNLPQYILNGWDYNATSGLCTREKGNNTLGLENNQYTYLMALTGLLVGFAFLFPLLNIISRGRS